MSREDRAVHRADLRAGRIDLRAPLADPPAELQEKEDAHEEAGAEQRSDESILPVGGHGDGSLRQRTEALKTDSVLLDSGVAVVRTGAATVISPVDSASR